MKVNYKIIKLRKEILNTNQRFYRNNKIINIFDKLNIPINKSIFQRLFQLLITEDFNQKLINFFQKGTPISHPLPKEWIKILRKNGVNVSIFSNFLFHLYKLKVLMKSFHILFTCLDLDKNHNETNFNYLSNLNSNVFKNIDNSNNLFTWFKNYFNDGEVNFCHDNKKLKNINISNHNLIYKRLIALNNVYLFPKLIFEYFVIFFKILCTNSILFFLLDEIVKLKIALKKKNNLPNKILFDHSEIFKPLWTYYFESINIKNIVYFYSTNNVPIVYDKDKIENIFDYITHGWELMSWRNYFVWDDYQKDFFANFLNLEKLYFKSTGPIPFGGKSFKFKSKKKIISIFDVSPFSNIDYEKICLPEKYYNFKNIKKFYEIIIKSNSEYHLVFKIKRLSKSTDLNYINYIQFLKKEGFDILEDICPFSLIKSSSKVISLPFTSPSIIAKHYNVDSIFFDPTNKLKFLNDYKFANHGVQILDSNEIKKWL